MMVALLEQRDPAFFDMAASLVDEVYEIGSTLGEGENAFLGRVRYRRTPAIVFCKASSQSCRGQCARLGGTRSA